MGWLACYHNVSCLWEDSSCPPVDCQWWWREWLGRRLVWTTDHCSMNFMRERREFPTHVGASRSDFIVNVPRVSWCFSVHSKLVPFPRINWTGQLHTDKPMHLNVGYTWEFLACTSSLVASVQVCRGSMRPRFDGPFAMSDCPPCTELIKAPHVRVCRNLNAPWQNWIFSLMGQSRTS